MATVINDTNIKSLITDYFRNKNSLPQDLRNKTLNEWVVSNVTNMDGMFTHCTYFNKPLNVGSEEQVSINQMINIIEEIANYKVDKNMIEF